MAELEKRSRIATLVWNLLRIRALYKTAFPILRQLDEAEERRIIGQDGNVAMNKGKSSKLCTSHKRYRPQMGPQISMSVGD